MKLNLTKLTTRQLNNFWDKVDKKENGCWLWQGATTRGHGTLTLNDRTYYAHRISWFIHNKSNPKELVCHSCDVKTCVNPDHLFLGGHGSNAFGVNNGQSSRSFNHVRGDYF